MAELMAVIEDLAVSWYPKWIKLNMSGQPNNQIKDGMSQPSTIKIQWSTCTGCTISCDVTPDKRLFEPMYAFAYTTLDFGLQD
jgi:hypothetical protein